jgi:hypothetical protein
MSLLTGLLADWRLRTLWTHVSTGVSDILVPLLKFVSHSAYHIIRRQKPPDPLQLELTDRLDFHGVLDCHQHSGTNQDLPRLDFIAEARGHIGHGPNGSKPMVPIVAIREQSRRRSRFSCPKRREFSVSEMRH